MNTPPVPPKADDFLNRELRFQKGIGPKRANELARAGLQTTDDLLHRMPIRFEDRSQRISSTELKAGGTVSVAGEIIGCGLRRTRRRGFTLFEMLLRDDAGPFRALWINQPFLQGVFAAGQHVVLYGKVELRHPGGLQVTNPQYEVVDPSKETDGSHTDRIVPIYERVGSLTSKRLRGLVLHVLQQLPEELNDPLPEPLRRRHNLPGRRDAFWGAHFPAGDTPLHALNAFRAPAQVRLIYEELFLFQLGLAFRRQARAEQQKPRVVRIDDRVRKSALTVLPFRLTAGQRSALRAIVGDMSGPKPMHRLLQGDVGCGKTIVALLAALVAMENELQVALMAPTELLAEQHYLSIRTLLASSRFKTVLLTGSTATGPRRETTRALACGKANLVVGTHALVQQRVRFRELGLVVIDEQHRFGVIERATLQDKGRQPDVLVMTATPIPRTLALTSYGDLDVSFIRDLPPQRRPIRTTVLPDSRRNNAYHFVKKALSEGRQAYVVYPLVTESEKSDLRAATAMFESLRTMFPDHSVGLLHGRMKSDQRDEVMKRFTIGDVQLLVATTVVEVGVDVPNATVMVVEHAERFGLAQLHQLRGRVGRGPNQSHCWLLHDDEMTEMARARLDALAQSTDGFHIAEQDLLLRGPGEMLGTRQSGLPTLRVANLMRDRNLMEKALRDAQAALQKGIVSKTVLAELNEAWTARFGLASVG